MEMKGRKVVGGEGPKRPKLILVGESLGAEEEAQGRPFVGTDGGILDGILSSARINRKELYVTNVIKVRPPNNKVYRLYEYGLAVEDFIPILEEELRGIECPVIVPVGDLALNTIVHKDSIGKHRGSIYPIEGRIAVPTYHPGFVREFWQSRGTVVEDLKKAVRVARDGYNPVYFNTILRPTLIEIEDFIKICLEAGVFVFDLETIGQYISCVGLGTILHGQRMSICIPLKHGLNNYWTNSDELYVWSILYKLFHSEALKIAQNITFDLTFLAPFIGEPSPPWYDLMVAHHTIDPELPHDLAYMTSIYTDIPYYKDDPKDKDEGWAIKTPSEVLWEYNGKDCEGPLIIMPKLDEEMRELRVREFYWGFAMPLVAVMWRMQRRGLKVDEEMKDKLLKERMVQLTKKQSELNEKVGYELNVNSPKQMLKFLYEDLRLPPHKNRKTGRLTANKETLEKLFAKHPDTRFQLVMELRDLTKDIGTYLLAEPDEDGRFRGRYNTTGTETGRSSCSKTIWDTGLDLQNIPPDLRPMFVADEGKVFMMYDLWQAEAYVVAIIANAAALKDKLTRGEKVHTMVASWLFQKLESEVSKEAVNGEWSEYDKAKRVVHASHYGLGYRLLSILLKIPEWQAKEFLLRYKQYVPEIDSWHKEVMEELKASRKLVTPFGRVRFFRNRYGEDMGREAFAHVPQSTIGDLTHQAMLAIEYRLPPEAEMVQEGYDSIIIEAPIDKIDIVDRIVRESFDKTLRYKGEGFNVPVEGKTEERWIK